VLAKYQEDWRATLLRYAPLALWVGVIAFLSTSSGSMAETSRFIGPILKYLLPNASEETLRAIHAVIRKLAHITEYSLLAFFAVRAIAATLNVRSRMRYILPLVLVAVVASADEINQSYDAARTGLPSDALLDVASGAIAIAIFWLLKWPRLVVGRDEQSDNST
jgi:VanZ family protein